MPDPEEFRDVSNQSIWVLVKHIVAIADVLKKELPFDSLTPSWHVEKAKLADAVFAVVQTRSRVACTAGIVIQHLPNRHRHLERTEFRFCGLLVLVNSGGPSHLEGKAEDAREHRDSAVEFICPGDERRAGESRCHGSGSSIR
jgi:hypothetical protein